MTSPGLGEGQTVVSGGEIQQETALPTAADLIQSQAHVQSLQNKLAETQREAEHLRTRLADVMAVQRDNMSPIQDSIEIQREVYACVQQLTKIRAGFEDHLKIKQRCCDTELIRHSQELAQSEDNSPTQHNRDGIQPSPPASILQATPTLIGEGTVEHALLSLEEEVQRYTYLRPLLSTVTGSYDRLLTALKTHQSLYSIQVNHSNVGNNSAAFNDSLGSGDTVGLLRSESNQQTLAQLLHTQKLLEESETRYRDILERFERHRQEHANELVRVRSALERRVETEAALNAQFRDQLRIERAEAASAREKSQLLEKQLLQQREAFNLEMGRLKETWTIEESKVNRDLSMLREVEGRLTEEEQRRLLEERRRLDAEAAFQLLQQKEVAQEAATERMRLEFQQRLEMEMKRIHDEYRGACSIAQQQVIELNADVETARMAGESVHGELTRTVAQLDTLQQQYAELTAQHQALTKEAAALRETVSRYEQVIKTHERKAISLLEQTSTLEARCLETEESMQKLQVGSDHDKAKLKGKYEELLNAEVEKRKVVETHHQSELLSKEQEFLKQRQAWEDMVRVGGERDQIISELQAQVRTFQEQASVNDQQRRVEADKRRLVQEELEITVRKLDDAQDDIERVQGKFKIEEDKRKEQETQRRQMEKLHLGRQDVLEAEIESLTTQVHELQLSLQREQQKLQNEESGRQYAEKSKSQLQEKYEELNNMYSGKCALVTKLETSLKKEQDLAEREEHNRRGAEEENRSLQEQISDMKVAKDQLETTLNCLKLNLARAEEKGNHEEGRRKTLEDQRLQTEQQKVEMEKQFAGEKRKLLDAIDEAQAVIRNEQAKRRKEEENVAESARTRTGLEEDLTELKRQLESKTNQVQTEVERRKILEAKRLDEEHKRADEDQTRTLEKEQLQWEVEELQRVLKREQEAATREEEKRKAAEKKCTGEEERARVIERNFEDYKDTMSQRLSHEETQRKSLEERRREDEKRKKELHELLESTTIEYEERIASLEAESESYLVRIRDGEEKKRTFEVKIHQLERQIRDLELRLQEEILDKSPRHEDNGAELVDSLKRLQEKLRAAEDRHKVTEERLQNDASATLESTRGEYETEVAGWRARSNAEEEKRRQTEAQLRRNTETHKQVQEEMASKIHQLELNITGLTDDNAALTTRLAQEDLKKKQLDERNRNDVRRRTEAEGKLDSLKDEMDVTISELHFSLELERRKLAQEIERSRQREDKWKEESQRNNHTILRLNGEIESANEQRDVEEHRRSVVEEKLREEEKRRKQCEDELRTIKQDVDDNNTKISDLNTELFDLKTAFTKVAAELDTSRGNCRQLEGELQVTTKELQISKHAYLVSEEQATQLNQEINELQQQVFCLQQDIASLNRQLSFEKETSATMQDRNNKLANEVNELKQQVHGMNTEKHSLEIEYSSTREALNRCMEQKQALEIQLQNLLKSHEDQQGKLQNQLRCEREQHQMSRAELLQDHQHAIAIGDEDMKRLQHQLRLEQENSKKYTTLRNQAVEELTGLQQEMASHGLTIQHQSTEIFSLQTQLTAERETSQRLKDTVVNLENEYTASLDLKDEELARILRLLEGEKQGRADILLQRNGLQLELEQTQAQLEENLAIQQRNEKEWRTLQHNLKVEKEGMERALQQIENEFQTTTTMKDGELQGLQRALVTEREGHKNAAAHKNELLAASRGFEQKIESLNSTIQQHNAEIQALQNALLHEKESLARIMAHNNALEEEHCSTIRVKEDELQGLQNALHRERENYKHIANQRNEILNELGELQQQLETAATANRHQGSELATIQSALSCEKDNNRRLVEQGHLLEAEHHTTMLLKAEEIDVLRTALQREKDAHKSVVKHRNELLNEISELQSNLEHWSTTAQVGAKDLQSLQAQLNIEKETVQRAMQQLEGEHQAAKSLMDSELDNLGSSLNREREGHKSTLLQRNELMNENADLQQKLEVASAGNRQLNAELDTLRAALSAEKDTVRRVMEHAKTMDAENQHNTSVREEEIEALQRALARERDANKNVVHHRNELLVEINELQQKCENMNSQGRQQAKDLAGLQDQLTLEKDGLAQTVARLEADLHNKDMEVANLSLDRQRDRDGLEALRLQLVELQQELAEANARVQVLEQAGHQQQLQLQLEIQTLQNALQAEKEALSRLIDASKLGELERCNVLKLKEDEVEGLQQALAREREAYKGVVNHRNELLSEIAEAKEKLDLLNKQSNTRAMDMDKMSATTAMEKESLQKQLERMKEDRANLAAELDELQSRASVAQTEAEGALRSRDSELCQLKEVLNASQAGEKLMLEQRDALTNELDKLKAKINRTEKEKSLATKTGDELQTMITKLQAQLVICEKQRMELDLRLTELTQQIGDRDAQIAALRQRIEELEDEVARLSNLLETTNVELDEEKKRREEQRARYEAQLKKDDGDYDGPVKEGGLVKQLQSLRLQLNQQEEAVKQAAEARQNTNRSKLAKSGLKKLQELAHATVEAQRAMKERRGAEKGRIQQLETVIGEMQKGVRETDEQVWQAEKAARLQASVVAPLRRTSTFTSRSSDGASPRQYPPSFDSNPASPATHHLGALPITLSRSEGRSDSEAETSSQGLPPVGEVRFELPAKFAKSPRERSRSPPHSPR